MKEKDIYELYNRFKLGEENFHNLMQKRVKNILLVSSLYDAYIFEHDDQIAHQLVGEYNLLNLTTVPRVTRAHSAGEALDYLKKEFFDLIITTMRPGETSPFKMSRKIKGLYPDLPIFLLLTVKSDINVIGQQSEKTRFIDKIFLWNGDSKLFLAMIKYVEDKQNAAHDTKNGLVRVILLVEDSIGFQSTYLPILYTEIIKQTQRLIQEEQNDQNKYYRMRTRPKVLLAENYEEAIDCYQKYKNNLLCVISDVEFTRGRKIDSEAGIKLISYFKNQDIYTPFLLQSSSADNRRQAADLGVSFLHKKSSTLIKDLSAFILDRLGFGAFVFRDADNHELERAEKVHEFERILPNLPLPAIIRHARQHDFSSWLIARGEFLMARLLRPQKPEDFDSPEKFRDYLIATFRQTRARRNQGKVLHFTSESPRQEGSIIRIGHGSLGGKGRGLAFLNSLLFSLNLEESFDGARVRIPFTVVICTSEFDRFIEKNQISKIIALSDSDIKRRFLRSSLPQKLIKQLGCLLDAVQNPLAVRSSGLLEDSQSQPFAGVYATYMLPNNHPDPEERLHRLASAIKLVYASVFLSESRYYLKNLNYNIEEEKMAVIIQEMVGLQHENYYYPHISGNAQSYNYYPVGDMKNADGVVSLALGLGQTVVGGEKVYRFCPKYPRIPYQSAEESLRRSQTSFYALDLATGGQINQAQDSDDLVTLATLPLRLAEKHDTLSHVVSVWSADEQRLIDSLDTAGPRVVTFANILKYDIFPLAGMIDELLDIAQKALGLPVEIEFAVHLGDERQAPTLYLLQVRPLAVNSEQAEVDLKALANDSLIVRSSNSLGNGVRDKLTEIFYVDPKTFDRSQTQAIQAEVQNFNQKMKNEGRSYVLVGPGRWGSSDKFLGIPVAWSQISAACLIIEAGIKDFEVEPSQGSHFLHNVISMNTGYLNVPRRFDDNNFIDWQYLADQPCRRWGRYCVWVRLADSAQSLIDGFRGRAAIGKAGFRIIKPGFSKSGTV